MIHILVDTPVDEHVLAKVRAIPEVHLELVEPEERVRPLPVELLRPIEVLTCMYPPENLSDMTNLRWIQIASAGYNQLYGLGLAAQGIRASNGRGCFDIPIAEWNIAMMVNLARDLRQMIRNQEKGEWDRSARFQNEIRGLTVGIWGYGGIGRETARLAKAMGMRVHVLSRRGIGPSGDVYCVPGTGDPEGGLPDRVYIQEEQTEFLSGLDFLVLTLPLTQSTEGIVGERELRTLPGTAYVLNPARGAIIEQAALLSALREGWIAGAALDAHYEYPMPHDHPLWQMPNVIMTPHISGSSLSPFFVRRNWDIFLGNLERYLSGKTLWNELTPEQLEGR